MLHFVTQVCYNFYFSYFLYFQLVIKFFKYLLQSNKVFGQKSLGDVGGDCLVRSDFSEKCLQCWLFSLQVDELTSKQVNGDSRRVHELTSLRVNRLFAYRLSTRKLVNSSTCKLKKNYQLVNLSPCQLVYYHHLLVKQ